MNTTKVHIQHLLESHGIVTVPGLGTFVRQSVPSTLSDNCISAPTTSVVFENYSCSLSDIELCASISQALACDTTQAEGILADDVEYMRREIEIGGCCTIESVGQLSKDGASLIFQPTETAGWLQKLPIEPLGEETSTTIDIAIEQRRETFMRSLRRTASSAAAIAIFLLIAFILSQLPSRDSISPQVASVGFDSAPLPVQPIGVIQEQAPAIVLVFNTPADASSPVETNETPAPTIDKSGDKYCLIVASLANRGEAEDYLRTYGERYKILEKDGRYRIYSLTGNSYASLMRRAEESGEYDRHPNAWICQK